MQTPSVTLSAHVDRMKAVLTPPPPATIANGTNVYIELKGDNWIWSTAGGRYDQGTYTTQTKARRAAVKALQLPEKYLRFTIYGAGRYVN